MAYCWGWVGWNGIGLVSGYNWFVGWVMEDESCGVAEMVVWVGGECWGTDNSMQL